MFCTLFDYHHIYCKVTQLIQQLIPVSVTVKSVLKQVSVSAVNINDDTIAQSIT